MYPVERLAGKCEAHASESAHKGWGSWDIYFLFIYGCAGSSLLHRLFLVAVSRGCSLPGVHRLQYMQHVGSAVVAPGLSCAAWVIVVHGLSCSVACGILLEQGLNPCLLHWQAEALPLNYQRSPSWNIYLVTPVIPWLKAPITLSIPDCYERVFIYLTVLDLGCGLQA